MADGLRYHYVRVDVGTEDETESLCFCAIGQNHVDHHGARR